MSKEEWSHIIDTEEGQKFALAVVEQVLDQVSTVIFKKRIQHQLIPYTLDYVKSVSLEIINWRFLEKDDGQWGMETWGIDVGNLRVFNQIEPERVQPDSWARGILKVSKQVPVVEKENILSVTNKQSKTSTTELKVPAPKAKIQMTSSVENKQEKSKEIIEPLKKLSMDQIIKQENRKILDRIHYMERDGSFANYTYDHDGRIILLRKSAPTKAFSPPVSVNIIDEKEQKKNKAPVIKDKKVDRAQKSHDSVVDLNEGPGFIPDDSLEIPTLVDVITVAPGVVFKEGGSVRVGGVFIPKVEEVLEPHPPKDAPLTQNDEVLTKILEKARPFVKS